MLSRQSLLAAVMLWALMQEAALAQGVSTSLSSGGSGPSLNNQPPASGHPNPAAGAQAGQVNIIDFGQSSTISIGGTLDNAGTLYLVSTNPHVTTGTLAATNIINQLGATITSTLPANIAQSLGSAVSNFSFVLAATNNIINAGTISSAGNLTLIAGGSITNGASSANTVVSNISSLASSTAVIQAVNNLSLFSSTGVINNSGLIGALAGNVSFNTNAGTDLIINNTLGTISALNGTVNIRDLLNGSGNAAILGGDVLARQIDVVSGSGHISIDVNDISGTLNLSGSDAFLKVAAPQVTLGTIELDGDPTFYNTTGSFLINTDLSFSGTALAIVANGDILTGPGVGKIDTSSSAANGADITMIAGAHISTSSGPQTTNPFAPVSLTIDGASGSGGKIDLTAGGSITALQSNSTNSNGNGGSINLIAYTGVAPGSGNIILPANVPILSGGNGTGTNGNVTIIGQSIQTGNINTAGGSGGGGNLSVISGKPAGNSTGSCSSCIYIANSMLTSGSVFTVGSGAAGKVTTGSLTAPGAAIIVDTGGKLLTGNIINDGLSGKDGGSVMLHGGDFLTPFTIGVGAVNGVNGGISAKGGIGAGAGGQITVNVGQNLVIQSGALLQVQPVAGRGGTISLSCGTLDFKAGGLSADAAGGNFQGGLISLSFTSYVPLASNLLLSANGSGNGNGGEVDVSGNSSTITFASGNGNFSVSARGGAGGGNGGTFNYSGGGAITIFPSAIQISPAGNSGNGGTFIVSPGFGTLTFTGPVSPMLSPGAVQGSGGNFTINNFIIGSSLNVVIPGGVISVNGKGPASFQANGGTINISGNTVSSSTGGAVTLSADASGIGNGGSITLQTRQSIDIGASGGNVILSAQGGSPGSASGNGGTIYLRSALTGTQVNINPNFLKAGPRGLNGDGASITIFRNPFLGGTFISGNLSADGVGTGNGGSITIVHGASFTIGSGVSSNGINGQLSAKAGAVSGNGGSISLEVDFGQLNLDTLSSLNVSTTKGNGGNISLYGNFGQQVNLTATPAVLDLSGKNGDFNGGTFFINGSPNLNPSGNFTINVDGSGNTGNGGTITLGTSALNPAASLTLSANGALSGNGGRIVMAPPNNVTLGFGPGKVFATATGGSAGSLTGNGGSVSISAPLVNYNAAGVNVNPLGTNGNGGSLSLSTLPIGFTGGISVNGVGAGKGGSLDLTMADSNLLNPLTANSGGAGGAGGLIKLTAPSLNVTDGKLISVNATAGDGGSIILNGVANITGALSANAASGNFNGGSITLSSALGVIPVGSLNANGAGTGKGGTISISSSNAVLSGFGSVSAIGGINGSGGSLTVQATSLALDSQSFNLSPGANGNGNGGSLTLLSTGTTVVNGDIVLDAAGNGSGGKLVIVTGSAGGFTVGSPFAGSGVTGHISAVAPGTGTGGTVSILGTPNPIAITVNSYIDTHSGSGQNGALSLFGIINFNTYQTGSLGGKGSIIGAAIGSPSTLPGPFTINLPQQNVPLILGPLNASGALSITAPSVLVPGTQTVSGSNTTFNAATVLNNGLIAATNVLTFNNNAGVTITGTGTLFAPSVVFNSSGGSVNVNQGNIIGTISGAAAGAFNVTFGSTLTSSGLLSAQQLTAPGTTARTIIINPDLSLTTPNQGSIIATDTIRISIPSGSNKESETSSLALHGGTSSIVFTAPNQVLTGSNSLDSTTIGEEGTEIAQEEEDATILRKGKILVDNGKKQTVVRTSLADVNIGSESTGLVESRPNGVTRVLAVSGQVTVNQKNSAEALVLHPGQDVLLSEKELGDEELIPVEGNTVVEAAIEKRSSRCVKRTMSIGQLTERNIMLSGSLVRIANGTRSQHKRLTEHIYRAIAAVEPQSKSLALARPSHQQLAVEDQPVRTFTDAVAQMKMLDSKVLKIENGSVFLQGTAGMIIRTPLADLQLVSPNSVSVEVQGTGLSIKACTGVGGVKVIVGKHSLTLCSGQELFLSQKPLPRRKYASDSVARRNALFVNIPGIRTSIVSEFSIMSFLSSAPHMGGFVQSRSRADVLQRDKILKCVAALQYARRSGAPFKSE